MIRQVKKIKRKRKKKKSGTIIQTETLRHQEAFNYYYLMGNNRSYLKVSQLTGVSLVSIQKWAHSFNWQQRLKERDDKNAAAIEKATDKKLVADKIEYRKQVGDLLMVLRGAIQVAVNTMKSGGILYDADGKKVLVSKFDCSSADGLSKVAAASEKLMRLDLTLMGESEQNKELRIKWAYEDGNGELVPPIDSKPVEAEFEGKNDGDIL